MVGLIGLAGCATSPPQIIAISPSRGARSVATDQPITVRFDRPMNRDSVARRFHVEPSVMGRIEWASDRELRFVHDRLRTGSRYTVVLDAGYQDLEGRPADRHRWSFDTEPSPQLRETSPSPGETGWDPGARLRLVFSAAMDRDSVAAALSLTPPAPLTITSDPGDARIVYVYPNVLLEPNRQYQLAVTSDARDGHGNRLQPGAYLEFETGPTRPAHGIVAFIASSGATPGSTGSAGSVWMVGPDRVPKLVAYGPAIRTSWESDSAGLLVERPDRTWFERRLSGERRELGISGDAIAPLTGGGYLVRDGPDLWLRQPDAATPVRLASEVAEVAFSPGGRRVAYTRVGAGNEVWVLDTGLRARYRLMIADGRVRTLAWSADGGRLLEINEDLDRTGTELWVKDLTGGDQLHLVASGHLGAAAWMPDSQQVIFSRTEVTDGKLADHLYRAVVFPAQQRELVTATGSLFEPVASPDGHQIAFVASDGQVWTVNADGSSPSRLTAFTNPDAAYKCAGLVWSPA